VLVAACPCALALAVPATLSAASDALARRGVLVLGVDAIEGLAKVDTVLFDKTGTLTEGTPRLRAMQSFAPEEDVLALAAGLELDSRHPLARAFDSGAAIDVSARLLHPGRGVEGSRDGARLRLGRADFAAGGVDDDALWLGREGHALARFEVEHALRADARETIAALQAQGLRVQVASGDAADAVARTCNELGIEDWESRLLPPDKLALLRDLQRSHHRVLAVGDGLNDAPLLAGADVSAAIGGGSTLAKRSADLLLNGEHLAPLADAARLSRRARAIMLQNLAWAAFYNASAIAIAACGLIAPGWAALGMAGSSLGVTLNALRAGRLP
jgi:Cu2+-exporting ATPase